MVALDGDPNIEIDRHPTVRAAKAQLDQAQLDLSYTMVYAPDDGIVARVEDLQVGDFVNPGAAVFSMMSTRRIWIEANFRETGLTHMRVGQAATIDVDAYPDRTFKAHVVSMSPGTGSDFAVLPPENATGNWVKVVQRLPVRLELDETDPNRPLFSGISVTARVDTGYCRYLVPSAPDRACGRGAQMSATLASNPAADGHRAITVAALMATYMQAVTISLPNAALLYIQGTLSMSDDEVGWIFTSYLAASIITMPMARWLAGRYGRKIVYQISIAIFALGLVLATRATTPLQFIAARVVQGGASGIDRSAVDGDPARYAAARAARPHQPGGGRNPGAWPPQRSQHRRLAQRISRLALDLLCRPASGGIHLPGDGALACRRSGPRRLRPSISSA